MVFIEFKNFSIKGILEPFSLSIKRGSLVYIRGSNGSGKTSLLKSIIGTLSHNGELFVEGRKVETYIKPLFNYCPQELESPLEITVYSFLRLYASKDRVMEISRNLSIVSLLDYKLPELSSGNRRMVLVARSLLSDRDIYIFDEPFSFISQGSKERLLSVIRELVSNNKTVLITSHELGASLAPNQTLLLENGRVYTDSVIFYNSKDKVRIYRKPNLPVLLLISLILVIVGFLVTPYLRVIWSVLAGGSLAVVGLLFQILFRNRLASPYTLGLGSGSSLGVLVASILESSVVVGSFIGGILSSLLLLLPRNNKDHSFLVLQGIAFASLVTSITLLFQSYLTEKQSYDYIRWQLGGLESLEKWSLFLAPVILVTLLYLYKSSNKIIKLGLDSDLAKSEGVNNLRLQLFIVVPSTVLVSLVVSQVGLLSFVGLVIPNITRRIYGDDFGKITLPTFLLGSLFTVLSELVLVLSGNTNITTGVVMALLGSPILILVVLLSKKTY